VVFEWRDRAYPEMTVMEMEEEERELELERKTGEVRWSGG